MFQNIIDSQDAVTANGTAQSWAAVLVKVMCQVVPAPARGRPGAPRIGALTRLQRAWRLATLQRLVPVDDELQEELEETMTDTLLDYLANDLHARSVAAVQRHGRRALRC